MVQGTTTQFRFQLPRHYNDFETIQVIFWQKYNNGPSASRPLPIIKTKKQCNTLDSGKVLAVTLNQEETLRFSTDRKAYVQLRALALDGIAYATEETPIKIYSVYSDDIIGDIVEPTPDPDDDYIIIDGGNIIIEDNYTFLDGGDILK